MTLKIARSGTIEGFDQVIIAEDGTIEEISPTSVSFADLYHQLLSLKSQLRPDQYARLRQQIESHIFSIGNPHGLTIDDIIVDPIRDLFINLLPGDPISNYSTCYLPGINDELITVERSSTMSYVDRDGILKYAQPNTLAIDYSDVVPRICMWPECSNLIASTDLTGDDILTAVGSSIVSGNNISNPENNFDNIYTCSSDVGITRHGGVIAIDIPSASQHNLSFFIYTHRSTKDIKICLLNPVTLDIVSELATINQSTVKQLASDITVSSLATGWSRVGISLPPNTVSITIGVYGYDGGYIYEGMSGILFDLWGLQLSETKGLPPYIPENSSIAPTTLSTDIDMLPSGFLSVGFDTSDVNINTQMIKRSIGNIDYDFITLDGSTVFVHVTSIYAPMTYPYTLHAALSTANLTVGYTNTSVSLKSTKTDTLTYTSTFDHTANIGKVKIMPFKGYIKHVMTSSTIATNGRMAFITDGGVL